MQVKGNSIVGIDRNKPSGGRTIMLNGFKPQEINDLEGARQAIVAMLNLVEELKQANQELRAENLRLLYPSSERPLDGDSPLARGASA
jgi:hypothetical protein